MISPSTLAPEPIVTCGPIFGPTTLAERRPMVTKGKMVAPGADLDDAVDHDLPVRQVDARLDDDRIADV